MRNNFGRARDPPDNWDLQYSGGCRPVWVRLPTQSGVRRLVSVSGPNGRAVKDVMVCVAGVPLWPVSGVWGSVRFPCKRDLASEELGHEGRNMMFLERTWWAGEPGCAASSPNGVLLSGPAGWDLKNTRGGCPWETNAESSRIGPWQREDARTSSHGPRRGSGSTDKSWKLSNNRQETKT